MSDFLSVLEETLDIKEAVSFREFVQGEDYCHDPDVYDYWLNAERSLPEHLSELILSGSLGNGKTTFASYYTAYRVYKLFLNGSPQKQLGLSDSSDIYFLYFSVSLKMAKKSGFTYLYNIFKNCKWFQKYAPINEELTSTIAFPTKRFFIDFASDFGHQISLNVWGYILDEANFRQGVGLGTEEQYEEVTILYTQLLDRLASRFARPDGSVDALAILISSAAYQSSFAEKRIREVQGDPNAAVIVSAAYEVKPEKYSSEKFEVFLGGGVITPCIIESEEQKNSILKKLGILGTGQEDQFFIMVPINLKKFFETNIILAIQNHAGRSTVVSSSFMSNLTFLYQSYTEDIPPIFQSFELEASTADTTQLIEYLLDYNIEYADRPHSLFLDLSIAGDAGALACTRYDGKDHRNYNMHTRLFGLRIIPPPFPAQTEVSKVKQLILDLAKVLNIVCFASDQYQSTNLRQDINRELGLEDIRISMDSSDVPYLLWQQALVEGRIRQVKDLKLEMEVRQAIYDVKRHRVLKAKKSSDDLMQAVVGSFFLSDTQGAVYESIGSLYSNRTNLIGGKSMSKVLKSLGYDKF